MTTRKLIGIIAIVALVISIPLTLALVRMRQEIRKSAFVAEGASSIALLAGQDTVAPGDPLDVTINLNTGGEDVYGFSITIEFNPQIFEPRESKVDTSDADLAFPLEFKNSVTPGKVEFDQSINPGESYINGAGKIGTIKLRVRDDAPLGTATINLVTSGDGQSGVYNRSLQDTLGQTTGASTIIQSSLSLIAAFEKISPSATEVPSVTVKVGPDFEKQVTFTRSGDNFTTTVTLAEISRGTYDVIVKGPFHLSQKLTGVTIPTSTPLDFTSKGPQLGGDLNKEGDSTDKIDITDVGVLLKNYDTSAPEADINFDGKVDMVDVGFLIKNYVLSTLALSIPLLAYFVQKQVFEIRKKAFVAEGPATLVLLPESGTFAPGDNLDININLDTGGKKIYGFSLTLNFDAERFEIQDDFQEHPVDTSTSTLKFPLLLKNKLSGGKVEYDATISPGGEEISGTGVLGTIRLRVKDGASGEGRVDFVTSGEEQSTVNTYEGEILGKVRGGVYTIQAPTAPTVKINSPKEGDYYLTDEEVHFQGSAEDREDGKLPGDALVWKSNVDGELGRGGSLTKRLSAGEHTITLTATDSDQQTGTDSVQIRVSEFDHVAIDPAQATVQTGQKSIFVAQIYDAKGTPLPPQDTEYTWSTEGEIGKITDKQIESDGSSHITLLAAEASASGKLKVTARIRDQTKKAEAEVTVTGEKRPLTCNITEVDEQFTINPEDTKYLSVLASGGTGNYSYSWEVEDGKGTIDKPSRYGIQWTAPPSSEVEDGERIKITATVSDGESTCSDSVTAIIGKQTATLNLTFKLEGRSHAKKDPIQIFAREPSSSVTFGQAPWKENITIETNAEGVGEISGLALKGLELGKRYEFLLKGPQHLQKSQTIASLENENSLDFGNLIAGDLNGNGAIGGDDISIWVHEIEGGKQEEYQSDINADGVVNGADVSIIIHNLRTEGD